MRYLPRLGLLLLLLAACADQTPTQIPALGPQPSVAAAPPASEAPPPTSTAPATLPAATDIPATPSPTPLVFKVDWAGYAAYRVQPGDTLESISQRGGSLPLLVSRYNRLSGEPQPGRELIVPQLPNTTSSLESTPMLVMKGNTAKPWVALTLDAGASSAPTPQILDTLAARQVHLTFFLTGKWIDENPELTLRIIADGHEIANHSYTHRDFTTLSDAEIADELLRTEEALARLAGPEVSIRPFFRPPFGAYDDRVLSAVVANGYLPVYWTFDSLDSVGEPKTAEFLTARITGHLPDEELPGAIILAHCGSQPTADALPAILDAFAARGFEVRPLSAVMEE